MVVFTDLDATLLDSNTYSGEPARESLNLLREMNASLILVSSEPFAEMVPIDNALELNDPFIVENSGGLIIGVNAALMARRTSHNVIVTD